jgi:hypothetical protein
MRDFWRAGRWRASQYGSRTTLEGIECWAGEREMANSTYSAVQNVIPMHELKWSHAEKTVARRTFDLALGKELEALVREAKGRAARDRGTVGAVGFGKLVNLSPTLRRSYDYRYSVLPLVFAQLLRDGGPTEDDLHGLGKEKLDLIRRASTL